MTDQITAQENQFVIFRLGRETYGLDISTVLEIITIQNITEVPGTDEFMDGIINLRGRVIPVLNLHKKFNLVCEEEVTRSTRIVVVEVDGCNIGMLVDEVSEVIRITKNSIEQPSQIMGAVNEEYLSGVAKLEGKLVILLDLTKVLQRADGSMMENVV